ncbi:hypothetical protein BX600DRAFT_526262 [Xylariales sp. PMI_506]|nr:hypothetical protein BX600DRAFT_526262 [Xylariales sp. PMI_506]
MLRNIAAVAPLFAGMAMAAEAVANPPTLYLDPANDPNDDGATTDTTITLEGAGAAAATITIYEAAVSSGTTLTAATSITEVPADATNGQYFVTLSNLPAGTTYYFTAKDLSAQPTQFSSPLSVEILDGVPAPSISNLLPLTDSSPQGDFATDDTSPIIVGTAEVGSTVTIYDFAGFDIDDVPQVLGTATVDASGNWQFQLPEQTLGLHIFLATQKDKFGQDSADADQAQCTYGYPLDGKTVLELLFTTTDFESPSIEQCGYSSIILNIVPTPPTLTGITPDSDTGVQGDLITTNATVTVEGTTAANASVFLISGGRIIGEGTSDVTTGAFEIPLVNLTLGDYYVQAVSAKGDSLDDLINLYTGGGGIGGVTVNPFLSYQFVPSIFYSPPSNTLVFHVVLTDGSSTTSTTSPGSTSTPGPLAAGGPFNGFVLLECAGGPATNWTLLYSNANNSPDECTAAAKAAGFKYAGLSGQDCYANNAVGDVTPTDLSNCNTPCTSDATVSCGGTTPAAKRAILAGQLILIYVDTGATTGPTTTSSVTGTTSTGLPPTLPTTPVVIVGVEVIVNINFDPECGCSKTATVSKPIYRDNSDCPCYECAMQEQGIKHSGKGIYTVTTTKCPGEPPKPPVVKPCDVCDESTLTCSVPPAVTTKSSASKGDKPGKGDKGPWGDDSSAPASKPSDKPAIGLPPVPGKSSWASSPTGWPSTVSTSGAEAQVVPWVVGMITMVFMMMN